jgi:hypothetical protein
MSRPNCVVIEGANGIEWGPHAADFNSDGVHVCLYHIPCVLKEGTTWTLVNLQVPQFALCDRCGASVERLVDVDFSGDPTVPFCAFCPSIERSTFRSANAQVSDAEATVVAFNPRTGDVVNFAMRNDQPIPSDLASSGYEPVRLKHFRQVEQVARAMGARSGRQVIAGIETDNPEGVDGDRSFARARREHEARVDAANRQALDASREVRRRGIKLDKLSSEQRSEMAVAINEGRVRHNR